jgi:hypothetical protein
MTKPLTDEEIEARLQKSAAAERVAGGLWTKLNHDMKEAFANTKFSSVKEAQNTVFTAWAKLSLLLRAGLLKQILESEGQEAMLELEDRWHASVLNMLGLVSDEDVLGLSYDADTAKRIAKEAKEMRKPQ